MEMSAKQVTDTAGDSPGSGGFQLKVLHAEGSRVWGGAMHALETYLRSSDRRRIAHDIAFAHPVPGTERFEELCQHVHDPCAPASPFADRGPTLASRLPRLVEKLPGFKPARLVKNWRRVRDMRRLIIAGGYDVVHLNDVPEVHAETVIAAWLCRCPVVAHFRNPSQAPNWDRWLGSRCSMLLAINRRLSQDLAAAGVRVPVHTVYDAVEMPAAGADEVQRVRRELAKPGEVLIGSVGRLVVQKGYEWFISAAARVLAQFPNARFVIAGDGSERAALEKQIASLGLGDRFGLLGHRCDATTIAAAFDLFVCSSLWEGGPLTVVEAMLLERPVVATDVGFVPEVIEHGRSGLVVPTRDPEALATAITRVLAMKPEERAAMGRAARHSAFRFTDVRLRAAELDDIFLRLAEQALKGKAEWKG
jgi:glycosyltransferase involved in cell wall biosynthesis